MAADNTSSIAGEAQDTRDRIGATIDELQDRLSPRRIVGDAVDSVQASGQELLDKGLGLARAHPAAIAAVAVAAGLAVFGSQRLKHARVDLGDRNESYSDYDDDYADRVATEGEHFALLRESGSAVADNPLVAVLIGLAAGALLGALFPETERERRLLGASADRFSAAAKAAARTAREELSAVVGKAGDVTSQAKAAVQSVVDAAKGELNG